MEWKITNIEKHLMPQGLNLSEILSKYNTSISEIEIALRDHVFLHKDANSGFQSQLHTQLIALFESRFNQKGCLASVAKYSPKLRLKPDVALERLDGTKRIFFEIEFRPNDFKDVVKFEIGYKYTLELGVMIMAINKNNINRAYKSMPNYFNFKKILSEYDPQFPMLLLGIDGEFSASE